VSVFADEFYNFAYGGFIDAVNKLRDANISLLLSHQSLADLERISPEYARAIWDSTRNKLVLYSNDYELCERLSRSVGTKNITKLTERRTADRFFNQVSALEASARQGEEFIISPNEFKSLRPGQGYFIQAGLAPPSTHPGNPSSTSVIGINLAMLPSLRPAQRPEPEEPDNSAGLHLYDLYIKGVPLCS
jgi:type IV secretory pathway TraG/TraD family ATPase VirD4